MDRPDFAGIAEDNKAAVRRVIRCISITNIIKTEVLTGDVLDDRYAILGTANGLFFVDITKSKQSPIPVPLIRNTRFRQVQIVSEYGVMIALSGKHDHVRQYKLSSIRKLVHYLTGGVASSIEKDRAHMSGNALLQREDDEYYKGLHEEGPQNEEQLVAKWTGDYIKILGTKDARFVVVQQTETSIFMGVLFRQDLTLFQWAKEPYSKFMKLKAFWLPETPKGMQLLHDGIAVTDICLIYSSEANIVSVEDSKVKDLIVAEDFESNAKRLNAKQPRWHTFSQIPFSESRRASIKASAASASSTVNRKLAAVTGKADLSTKALDRYFLSTYHSHTRVVDITAQPMVGSGVGGWKDGVSWPEPPQDIVLQAADYVLSIGKNNITAVDWKSANAIQSFSLDAGGALRVLSPKSGSLLVSVDRRKKGSVVYFLLEPGREGVVSQQQQQQLQPQRANSGIMSSGSNGVISGSDGYIYNQLVEDLENIQLSASAVRVSQTQPNGNMDRRPSSSNSNRQYSQNQQQPVQYQQQFQQQQQPHPAAQYTPQPIYQQRPPPSNPHQAFVNAPPPHNYYQQHPQTPPQQQQFYTPEQLQQWQLYQQQQQQQQMHQQQYFQNGGFLPGTPDQH